jgi:hypothetical protein
MKGESRESVVSKLKRLHAAPKNIIKENLRTVTQSQLDFYFAAHGALPDLLAVVEAAQELLQKHGIRPAPTIGLSADLVSLNVALAALTSEQKPGVER